MTYLTPLGVNDFLPQEMVKFDGLLTILNGVFENANYRKVRTPSLEFYDTLSGAMGSDFGDWAVKLFDPKGNVLVLRPDHTVPIARMVASQFGVEDFPLRLSYSNPIFRKPKSHEQDLETFQAGVELIGCSGPDADVEILTLVIESLKALGIQEFSLDIGHVDFVNQLPPQDLAHLISGDYVALGHIPERGKVGVVQDYPDLVSIYTQLQAKGLAEHVYFNKGLVKPLGYYTGVIFEVVIPQMGYRVAQGGRYDGLLSKFGLAAPAVGFALDLSRLRGLK